MSSTCPICGEEVELDHPGFSEEWHVWSHAIEKHLASDNRPHPNYQCWCGERHPFWSMQDHFEELGGMVAHYLACQLEGKIDG